MVFKSDKQRKAVMAKLNPSGTRSDVTPVISKLKRPLILRLPSLDLLVIKDLRRLTKKSDKQLIKISRQKGVLGDPSISRSILRARKVKF